MTHILKKAGCVSSSAGVTTWFLLLTLLLGYVEICKNLSFPDVTVTQLCLPISCAFKTCRSSNVINKLIAPLQELQNSL